MRENPKELASNSGLQAPVSALGTWKSTGSVWVAQGFLEEFTLAHHASVCVCVCVSFQGHAHSIWKFPG